MDRVFRRLLGAGIISILLCLPVQAEDPLDDVDGTEGWDQVVQPTREKKRDIQAEQDAFKREVADWESIRQLWEEQRERYIMEKTAHQRQFKRMKAAHRQRRRPPPKADITEETLSKPKPSGEGDWGDEPGQEWFQGATPAVDSVIDDELGESGAVPGTSKEPARTRPAPVYIPPPSSSKGGEVPDAFKQRKKAPDPEAAAAEDEILRMREAEERKRREAEEKRRLQEEMGFDCSLRELFSFVYKAPFDNGLTEHELDHVMVGHYDLDPVINTAEVAAFKWMPMEDVKKDILEQPERYTEWFKIIFKEYQERLL